MSLVNGDGLTPKNVVPEGQRASSQIYQYLNRHQAPTFWVRLEGIVENTDDVLLDTSSVLLLE